MKKKQMIDFINDRLDWYEAMTMGLGHYSWHYTNRSSDDCINVKLYAGICYDELIDHLTDRQKKIIKVTGFDVKEWLTDYIWSDFGIIDQERDQLECDLKERFNVKACEYGGRSGGWLAVVYDWDDIPDDLDNEAYSYSEVKEYYQMLKKAIKENEQVIEFVENAKNNLKKQLNDPNLYLEELNYQLNGRLSSEIDRARGLLSISELEGLQNE